MKTTNGATVMLGISLLFLGGCTTSPSPSDVHPARSSPKEDKIRAALAGLSKEDLALVEAQGYCPISPEQRLGAMDVPVKVMIKNQPVFLCCAGCERSALIRPDATLAKVAELKLRAKDRQPEP